MDPVGTYTLSLRIRHPEVSAGSISEHLQIAAKHQWSKGDARSTPLGRPLPGLHESTYWSAELCSGSVDDLPCALVNRLESLKSQRGYFSRLAEDGGEVEFFVGIFLNRHNAGFCLSSKTLQDLGKSGIDLSVDLYSPQEQGKKPFDEKSHRKT